MNEVTRILSAIEQGDPKAAAQLLPLVYEELRKLGREAAFRLSWGCFCLFGRELRVQDLLLRLATPVSLQADFGQLACLSGCL